ncbi:DUF6197 family protein [Micromonospora purpureochromogenes]|uniref:Uncharacterized protein n=1 Tax=Micromonospora purpureochromogenes TaxID=47872 RepID=A0ABX2RQJ8_9ACTN|nr:hypothetical protein [Micromonospora purpureochromogenes]NYF58805.1 hypothetical protein [Micromonospora purpureochromogenes]
MNPTQEPLHTPGALADLTPADILRCAARYLEVHGWTQGNYYGTEDTPFPPACVSGALGMAAYGRQLTIPHDDIDDPGIRDYRHALDVLSCYLYDNSPDPVRPYADDTPNGDPFEWNDRPGRTAEQVITTLRATADDYDWTHATEDDLETYAESARANEVLPTREGFLAWLGAR